MEVGSSSLPGTTALEGGLAQLARAPALQAGGQRFESVILHGAPDDIKKCSAAQVIFDMLTHKTVSKDFMISRSQTE